MVGAETERGNTGKGRLWGGCVCSFGHDGFRCWEAVGNNISGEVAMLIWKPSPYGW